MSQQNQVQVPAGIAAQAQAIVSLCVLAFLLGGAFALGAKAMNAIVPTETVTVIVHGTEVISP